MKDTTRKIVGCLGCSAAVVVFGVVLVVLLIIGVFSLDTSPAEPPSPEPQTARDWSQDEAKQPDRKALIDKTVALGIFRKVDLRSTGATIWVGEAFYNLDFEMKQDACSVVHAYVATNAKDEMVAVTLNDARSGKTVGTYYGPSLGLKMK